MRWLLFLARRLAGGALVLLVLSVGIFAATEILPGDVVGVIGGPQASAAERARIRTELGLDRPAVQRYLEWITGALHGDLGTSFVGQREVTEVLLDRVPNSLLLAGLALALVIPLSTVFGLIAGLRAGRPADRAVSTGAMAAVAVPEFLTAALLVAVLAGWLDLLPAVSLIPLGGSPLDVPKALVLPVLSLLPVGLALGTRLIRSSAADVAASPYVEAARLRGVCGLRLAVRHVLPNALAPAVQVFAMLLGSLVGSAIVVETVFNYPGVGYALAQAVAHRDIPLVQGLALALVTVAVLALLLGDVATKLLDPRVRERL